MRTALDTELFPDRCEVVAMPLHNQWVYIIQKNGSSSLSHQRSQDNLVVLVNDEIRQLDFVDVYIRNPKERYISGVNTYLQHLERDFPHLDLDTAFWFAKRYKFLNTHYLPQFHWLSNLSRYLASDAKIRIRNFGDFDSITDYQSRALVEPPTSEFAQKLLQDDNQIELWLYLDQILLDLAGKEFTWHELLEYYKNNHENIIQHVLPKT